MAKVKNFFKKIGVWFKNHKPSKRRLIQLYAALLVNANLKGFIDGRIYTGPVKNICSPGLNCYSCPGASGACPLGALQDSLAASGTRAPYYIIGILALYGLILARTICGFLCPVGLGQELLHKVKTPKLQKSRFTRVLSYFKYVLLAVLVIAIPLIYHGIPAFCKYVCPAGTFEGGVGLISNPNNNDFYAMLNYLFSWKFILLVIFVVGSIFCYRFFCRFFCPLGAIYGFFNKYALIGVKLERDKCVECGMCLATCKMDIRHVGDHECINCGECIPVCPTKAISWKGSQIFVKGIDDTPAEQGALASVLASGEVNETAPINVAPDRVEDKPLPEILQCGINNSQAVLNTPVEEKVEEQPAADKTEKTPLTKSEKIKKRNFWLQVSAWAAALVLLLAALLYYNVFNKGDSVTVYKVGDRCPDLVLSTYNSAGNLDDDGSRIETFSTLENKGTVMVINFWYTDCDPCVAELPYFEQVRAGYGDSIIMVAVHSDNGTTAEDIQSFIDAEGDKGKTSWSDWGIIFAQDFNEETGCYIQLGGKGAYPMTVVVDTDGKISCVNHGKMEEAELIKQIDKALGK